MSKKTKTKKPQSIEPIAQWRFGGLTEEMACALSGVAEAKGALWVGGDEGTKIARLTPGADAGQWNAESQIDLTDRLRLPDLQPDDEGRLPEVDIEGMDFRDGVLWLVGSHSLKRKKSDKADEQENIRRLAKVSSDGNRYFLGRLALGADGAPLAPEAYTAGQCTGRLDGDKYGSALLGALQHDEHFGRFLPAMGSDAEKFNIPGKDNGLDFEGLAAVGPDHLLLGLRGPVLRGWAALLEIKIETQFSGPGHPALLTLAHFDKVGRPYRKIFLDLDGLGVRDLCLDGDDLLILAGPTMDLPWPVTVYRWPGARNDLNKHDRLITREKLSIELLANIAPEYRAEGLAIVEHNGQRVILIAYDNAKRSAQGVITADIFPLANSSSA